MLSGALYNASDPQLVAERRRARDFVKVFNDTRDDEGARRQAMLASFFGGVGTNIMIEPPFYCDYGNNTFIDNDVFLTSTA